MDATNEPSMPARKRQARRDLRQRLAELSAEQRQAASLQAAGRASQTPEWQDARAIMLYLALPDELDSRPLIQQALAEGRQALVPRVTDPATRQMSPVPIHSLEEAELQLAHYGVRVPSAALEAPPLSAIDLVIVPGLGFSRRGQRIGRGLGFYDRFLAHPQLRAVRCGLAFDAQVLDELPADEHDRPMHMLVTESGVLRF